MCALAVPQGPQSSEDGLRKVRGACGALPVQPHAQVGSGSPAVTSPPTSFPPQDILGYTWPGIEYGEPPSCAYTFFEVRGTSQEVHAPFAAPPPTTSHRPLRLAPQYIDALRLGDLARFRRLEAACQGWYTPSLDRGAGAALHFAVDHGRLEAVKYLVGRKTGSVESPPLHPPPLTHTLPNHRHRRWSSGAWRSTSATPAGVGRR